jgi:hypothetical protein
MADILLPTPCYGIVASASRFPVTHPATQPRHLVEMTRSLHLVDLLLIPTFLLFPCLGIDDGRSAANLLASLLVRLVWK